jgi:hypothetical protein
MGNRIFSSQQAKITTDDYIDVDLTNETVGSNQVLEQIKSSPDYNKYNHLRNIIFLMLNRKFADDEALKIVDRNSHYDYDYDFDDWQAKIYTDIAQYIRELDPYGYCGNLVRRTKDVIDNLKRLDGMKLEELSTVSGISIPKKLLYRNKQKQNREREREREPEIQEMGNVEAAAE